MTYEEAKKLYGRKPTIKNRIKSWVKQFIRKLYFGFAFDPNFHQVHIPSGSEANVTYQSGSGRGLRIYKNGYMLNGKWVNFSEGYIDNVPEDLIK